MEVVFGNLRPNSVIYIIMAPSYGLQIVKRPAKQSYFELAHFLDSNSDIYFTLTVWRIKALANLENCFPEMA
jgi:hypothetical protein